MPLKAIVRGYSYAIVPDLVARTARTASKLALQEMGSRYLFIVLYVFLEHHLAAATTAATETPSGHGVLGGRACAGRNRR